VVSCPADEPKHGLSKPRYKLLAPRLSRGIILNATAPPFRPIRRRKQPLNSYLFIHIIILINILTVQVVSSQPITAQRGMISDPSTSLVGCMTAQM